MTLQGNQGALHVCVAVQAMCLCSLLVSAIFFFSCMLLLLSMTCVPAPIGYILLFLHFQMEKLSRNTVGAKYVKAVGIFRGKCDMWEWMVRGAGGRGGRRCSFVPGVQAATCTRQPLHSPPTPRRPCRPSPAPRCLLFVTPLYQRVFAYWRTSGQFSCNVFGSADC